MIYTLYKCVNPQIIVNMSSV
jgi:hypothetical protein